MLTDCNFIEEQKAEGIIKNCFLDIIDGDYEKAFEQLHQYDYESKTEDSKLVEGRRGCRFCRKIVV